MGTGRDYYRTEQGLAGGEQQDGDRQDGDRDGIVAGQCEDSWDGDGEDKERMELLQDNNGDRKDEDRTGWGRDGDGMDGDDGNKEDGGRMGVGQRGLGQGRR